jgi:hypothetical protein
MILTIPYQAFEVGNIHVTPFSQDKYGKTIARLTYKDNSIDFQDVCILTPPLTVIDYQSEHSRLRLDISQHFNFQVKMNTLQEYLISTFYVHQQSFLHHIYDSQEYIKRLFHCLLEESVLSLYIYPSLIVKMPNGTYSKVSDLVPGDTIRCVIRFQGVTQFINKYGLRLRLQHSVPSIWHLEHASK